MRVSHFNGPIEIPLKFKKSSPFLKYSKIAYLVNRP